ncbi:MarR family winged helix-turn-helix transcriptional regulator [Labedella endophytica]|uniref:MarR family transcriptional regulator n=1 Tax=Labedella endophytica TaxID=1523160 RepID=A0A3S0X4I3_9MICO|nr:MarR family transcriptional regulator [Labedella endophytica]RUQ98010.1 MarR family transcriptional regulator [Labedella endophytica]
MTEADGTASSGDRSVRYVRHVEDESDMQVGETRHRSTSISATVTSIRARPDGSRPAMTREEALAADVDPVVDPDRAEAADRASSGDILTLLREYRAAETTSRREARRETAMGETDLLAMRLLVDAKADGRLLTPGAIATALGISTASTTALIDRLSSADFVERRPHETDRRSTVIVPTVRSDREVREALGRGQASIARVADDMTQDEIDVVARFLTNLISAVRDDPEAP